MIIISNNNNNNDDYDKHTQLRLDGMGCKRKKLEEEHNNNNDDDDKVELAVAVEHNFS